MPVSIASTIKGNAALAGLPFSKIASAVLGPSYEVSLTFVGTDRMRALNRTHRNRDYATDILSFILDESLGDIYICPEIARKKAHERGESDVDYLSYLFIHGCLHLKGLTHGSRMEGAEKTLRQRFSLGA